MGVSAVWGRLGLVVPGLCLAAIVAVSHGSAAAQSDRLDVVVTIKPVHSLVAQVMEGVGEPSLLIEGRASPHAFSLRPSDAKALNSADVVVRVGPSLEPFTVRLAETLGSETTLVTLAEAPGVEVLQMRRGSRFEAHEHSDSHDHGHAETGQDDGHGHGDKDADDDVHAMGGLDAHIWLDPDNAKAIVRYIANVLGSRRPEMKDKFSANATKAIAAIDALDAEVRADIAPIVGKPFVVFHDAYQYFERHYGLQAAGAITLNPEVKPSARRLSEIRETLAETGASCVFAEPQFSPRIVASVIEGSHAKAGTLDPLGADLPAGPDHYAALMRTLGKDMVACLGKSTG